MEGSDPSAVRPQQFDLAYTVKIERLGSDPKGSDPFTGEGRRGSGGLQEEEGVEWGLSVRQLPQHMNGEESVHGGSAAYEALRQRVESHGCSLAARALLS
jgi:hypothetical protein